MIGLYICLVPIVRLILISTTVCDLLALIQCDSVNCFLIWSGRKYFFERRFSKFPRGSMLRYFLYAGDFQNSRGGNGPCRPPSSLPLNHDDDELANSSFNSHVIRKRVGARRRRWIELKAERKTIFGIVCKQDDGTLAMVCIIHACSNRFWLERNRSELIMHVRWLACGHIMICNLRGSHTMATWKMHASADCLYRATVKFNFKMVRKLLAMIHLETGNGPSWIVTESIVRNHKKTVDDDSFRDGKQFAMDCDWSHNPWSFVVFLVKERIHD